MFCGARGPDQPRSNVLISESLLGWRRRSPALAYADNLSKGLRIVVVRDVGRRKRKPPRRAALEDAIAALVLGRRDCSGRCDRVRPFLD